MVTARCFDYSLDTLKFVKLMVASISPRRSRAKSSAAAALTADYIARAARYVSCEAKAFDSEAAFLAWLGRQSSRTPPALVLCDGRGELLSSEEIATRIGRLRDSGTQLTVLAVGPADGWSAAARARASLTLAFGRITLPHELVRAVLAEQVFRALTILAGHPYHCGH